MKIPRNKQKTGAAFLVSIFVILVTLSVWLAVSLRVDSISDALKNDDVMVSLFVMEKDNRVLFTDVFLYYPMRKQGALINIVGNTGAIWQSLDRTDRIDAIYSDKGMETYRDEIAALIGQPIPYYFLLRFDDFGELTDLLGGMKIFIPSPIDIRSEDGGRWLLPGGAQNLDGDKIHSYLTYVLPDETEEELDERRQLVVRAFFNALAKNSRVLQSRRNFNVVFRSIGSNLDRNDVFKLIREFSLVDSERLVPQAITGSLRTVDEKPLLFPWYDGQLIKDVVQQTMVSLKSDSATTVSRNTIEILNGTMVKGLAANTARNFQGTVYDVLRYANADTSDYEKTVIINHTQNDEGAKNLGDFIDCDNIISDEDMAASAASNVDYTIILGADFDGRRVR